MILVTYLTRGVHDHRCKDRCDRPHRRPRPHRRSRPGLPQPL